MYVQKTIEKQVISYENTEKNKKKHQNTQSWCIFIKAYLFVRMKLLLISRNIIFILFIYNVFLGIRQSKLENFGNRIKLLSWTNLALLDANQAYNK